MSAAAARECASEALVPALTQAQRSAEGRIVLFRPDMNCARMAAGADRMCMPEVPESMFIDAVKQVQVTAQLSAYPTWKDPYSGRRVKRRALEPI